MHYNNTLQQYITTIHYNNTLQQYITRKTSLTWQYTNTHHTHKHRHIHICKYTYVHTQTRAYRHKYVCIYAQTHVRTDTHSYENTYVRTWWTGCVYSGRIAVPPYDTRIPEGRGRNGSGPTHVPRVTQSARNWSWSKRSTYVNIKMIF